MNLQRFLRVSLTITATVVLVGSLAGVAAACPSCKEALASSDGSQGDIVSGYFWSILFMMSMPFVILSTFVGGMYLTVRRARATQAAAPPTAVAGERRQRELVEA